MISTISQFASGPIRDCGKRTSRRLFMEIVGTKVWQSNRAACASTRWTCFWRASDCAQTQTSRTPLEGSGRWGWNVFERLTPTTRSVSESVTVLRRPIWVKDVCCLIIHLSAFFSPHPLRHGKPLRGSRDLFFRLLTTLSKGSSAVI